MSTSIFGELRSVLRDLADDYPFLRGPIGRVWNTYERLRFRYHTARNVRDCVSEPASVDPYRLLTIPPEAVRGHSPGSFDSISDAGRVVDGEWDLSGPTLFEDRFRLPSFQNHFVDNIPWKETEFYKTKTQKICSDRQAKYASVAALDRKCAELDRIYKQIETDGYRTQTELRTKDGSAGSIIGDGGRGLLPGSAHLVRHEIAIDIGRDGELLLNEGRHRMCIAKILGLEMVPARVVVRHRHWQEIRNEVTTYIESQDFASRSEASTAIEKDLLSTKNIKLGIDHPDIRVILDSFYSYH